jgi:hypothetical protein
METSKVIFELSLAVIAIATIYSTVTLIRIARFKRRLRSLQ